MKRKLSVSSAALILAAAAMLNWRMDLRMAQTNLSLSQNRTEAVRLGVLAGPSGVAAEPDGTLEEQELQRLTVEMLDLAVKMSAAKALPGGPDPDLQLQVLSSVARIMALKPEDLKRVIAESLVHPGLSDELRQQAVQELLIQWGSTHPQEALATWAKGTDKFPDTRRTRVMVSRVLQSWSGQDRQAAMEWVRGHMGDFPDILDEEVRLGMVKAAATHDPALALSFTDELAISDRMKAVEGIASAARGADACTTALIALREYAAGLDSPEEGGKIMEVALPRLAEQAGEDGFAACSAWLESADLTGRELARCIRSVPPGREPGLWMEWIGDHLPPTDRDAVVRDRMERWTTGDHQAAGNWLNSAPDGLVRQAAIRAFAETVARYEPESAEKWALTLPEGPQRISALRKILTEWPAQDAAGKESAAAFARRHGLE